MTNQTEATGEAMAEKSSFQFGTWYPIESAPHGRLVIVYGPVPGYVCERTTIASFCPSGTLQVPEGYEGEDWAEERDGEWFMPADWYESSLADENTAVNLTPTHWMPLPPPPSDASA